jgi:hypothetical protein
VPPSELIHSMKVERPFCPVGYTCEGADPDAPGGSPNSAAVTGERLFSKCGRDKGRLAYPKRCAALAALPEAPGSYFILLGGKVVALFMKKCRDWLSAPLRPKPADVLPLDGTWLTQRGITWQRRTP